MQCCSSQCIVAMRFEAHQIFEQVLLYMSRIHKHVSIARLASCRPVALHDLYSIHDHGQTLLSFMLSSISVGPLTNLSVLLETY